MKWVVLRGMVGEDEAMERDVILRIVLDAVVVTHFAFILFVVFGGLLCLRWKRAAWLHVPALAWGLLIELAGWSCPLTPLELHLRELLGRAAYAGGFIEHYIVSLVYPQGLTRGGQLALGLALAVFNAAVYALAFRPRRDER